MKQHKESTRITMYQVVKTRVALTRHEAAKEKYSPKLLSSPRIEGIKQHKKSTRLKTGMQYRVKIQEVR